VRPIGTNHNSLKTWPNICLKSPDAAKFHQKFLAQRLDILADLEWKIIYEHGPEKENIDRR
jgi:hypothetical protein